MSASLSTIGQLLTQPLRLLRGYPRTALHDDLLAGITVSLVLLPQALAFSLLAGLPPVMGLYTALVAAIVGSLWGSSSHLHSGPTNTAAILTFTVLAPLFTVGSAEFSAAAGLLALLAGLIKLLLGLARLGLLVNFVSDAVAVGFTAGAGLLIIVNQLAPILRLPIASTEGFVGGLGALFHQITAVHLPSLLLGLGTILMVVIWQRSTRRIPGALAGVILLSLVAWLFGMERHGVRVMGTLPVPLPTLAILPIFDLELIGKLANAALAIALIGLVEAVAIARAIADHSRQRLNSNQEFVGQGLACIGAGLFGGYPCSGSFNRSALSYQAGAKTALANAISGLFLILAVALFNPLLAHIPLAVLAGVLAVSAWSMIDLRRMVQIWRTAPGDASIMLVTFVSTLLLPLQFAILLGVILSLGYHLLRTSRPRVVAVLPDADYKHWEDQQSRLPCPQLAVIDIAGDLYFGAVNHIEEAIETILSRNPGQRFLLLRLHSVQHCDISGIRMLERLRTELHARGGALYMTRIRDTVLQYMQRAGFLDQLGPDHLLEADRAIQQLFQQQLDRTFCRDQCTRRVFRECQTLAQSMPPNTTELIPLFPRDQPVSRGS